MKLRAFLTSARLLAVAGVVAASPALARAARAQEPTPTPVADLGLDTDAVFGLIGPSPLIRWRPLAAAASFRLTGSLYAGRVNRADPFCTPPARADTRTIAVDQTLDGTATELPVGLPAISDGDAWFVSNVQVGLRAFDDQGREIGAQLGGGVAEARCARPPTTATPAATPPAAAPGSMTVTALVPAPPGTDVRLEVLDVPTVKPVRCASATSTADAAAASSGGRSRVTFVVARATCIDPYSGALRICWNATACSGFEYQDGQRVDLGLLSTASTSSLPSVGDGTLASGDLSRPSAVDWSLYGLLALSGLTLAAVGAFVAARRRRPSH